jgi:hypothetical protein
MPPRSSLCAVTMKVEEICRLEIPAVEDVVLFLWATAPKLEKALRVLRSLVVGPDDHQIQSARTGADCISYFTGPWSIFAGIPFRGWLQARRS